MRAILCCLCAVVCLADSKPARQIPALVAQLGADTRAERDAASKELASIGGKALPELRQALRSKDAEIRKRARRLVEQIEQTIFREVLCITGHTSSVHAVTFSADGKCALAGDSRGVRLWDLTTGKLLARAEDHRDRVMAVAMSPDGTLAATGSEDRTVRLWDAKTLKERFVLRGHRDAVRAVAFRPGGKVLVSAGLDGLISEWDITTGRALRQVIARGRGLFGLACLDADRVLAAGRGTDDLEMWDLKKGALGGTLKGHDKLIMTVGLSRDGKVAITPGHDLTIRLWDVAKCASRMTLRGHIAEATCAALSPDGNRAVSGGFDQSVRVWDTLTGRQIRELKGHTGPVWSVAISPDGTRALSGGNDCSVRLWALEE